MASLIYGKLKYIQYDSIYTIGNRIFNLIICMQVSVEKILYWDSIIINYWQSVHRLIIVLIDRRQSTVSKTKGILQVTTFHKFEYIKKKYHYVATIIGWWMSNIKPYTNNNFVLFRKKPNNILIEHLKNEKGHAFRTIYIK